MKPLHGLLLAIGLGIGAAFFNFAYLNLRSKDIDKVYYIGVKPDAVVNRGDALRKEQLAKVGIPAGSKGNLDNFAVPWDDLSTVENMKIWRTLSDGALLLRDDLRTPPQELDLGENERAMWIPVDTRAFVPSLVVPGDMVSFIVPRSQARRPTPAGWDTGDANPAAGPSEPVEIIGPFKILSLGNRLGSPEVMQAAKIRQVQENVMTIRAREVGGQLEPKAQKLMGLLQSTGFRGVGVLLHNRKQE